MRALHLTALTALAALGASPLSAQVAARVHIDIPVGRPGHVVGIAPRGRLTIREYDPALYGAWDGYYDQWSPETVYLDDGYYYDYPVDEYATPVVVYGFRDALFFAPRAPAFIAWRDRWHPELYREGFRGRPVVREGYRPAPVYDRGYRAAPRFGGNVGAYREAPRPVVGRPAPAGRDDRRVIGDHHGAGGGSAGRGPRSGSGRH